MKHQQIEGTNVVVIDIEDLKKEVHTEMLARWTSVIDLFYDWSYSEDEWTLRPYEWKEDKHGHKMMLIRGERDFIVNTRGQVLYREPQDTTEPFERTPVDTKEAELEY
jgi:hypothetical protein